MQVNYTYSKDKSDDDNERDPFTFRYAKIHEDPANPNSEFSSEWGYSDRDQRHRVNAYTLWQTPGDFLLNFRYSYRSAQPLDVTAAGVATNSPQDRINQSRRHSRERHPAQPRPQEQSVFFARLPDLQAVPIGLPHDRAFNRRLQPLQLQKHQETRDDQPRLQLRRHGAERRGRPPTVPVRRPRGLVVPNPFGRLERAAAHPPPFLFAPVKPPAFVCQN